MAVDSSSWLVSRRPRAWDGLGSSSVRAARVWRRCGQGEAVAVGLGGLGDVGRELGGHPFIGVGHAAHCVDVAVAEVDEDGGFGRGGGGVGDLSLFEEGCHGKHLNTMRGIALSCL